MLAVALTVATGATGAISYTRLGSVFSSVMTGNLVLLGLSAGREDAGLAGRLAVAIVGYMVGALVGSRIAGAPDKARPVWPVRVTVALLAESVVLGGLLAGWEVGGSRPGGRVELGLLAAAVLAMGVQAGAVRAIGIPGLSTTYLTGTLTGVLAELATTRSVQWRSIAILVGLVSGAAGGLLAVQATATAPLLPIGVLAVVLLASTAILLRPPDQGQKPNGSTA